LRKNVALPSARISSVIFGRPPCGLDCQRQYRRKPARCHPTTVSGFTRTRTSDQRGHICRRLVQKKRLRRFSEGRGRLRLSTATAAAMREFQAKYPRGCGTRHATQTAHPNTSGAFDYGQRSSSRITPGLLWCLEVCRAGAVRGLTPIWLPPRTGAGNRVRGCP